MSAGDHSKVPGIVRMWSGAHSSAVEIDAVADALQRIARGDYRGHHVQDRASGEFTARLVS